MGGSSSKERKIKPPSASGNMDDYVEGIVCKENDLQENDMKSFDLGESKVLVVKQKGKIYALGNKCSHYGAPMSTGVLGNGRVRCPWHGACFNLTTGDIEEFPGLDGIPCFQVDVEKDGGVKVRAQKSLLKSGKFVKTMASKDPENCDTIVIAGGGPAGACCAETLRQEGFTGRIVLVSKEPHLPYDRIKLSKFLDSSADKLELRSQSFYNDHGIEIMTGVELTDLDSEKYVVHLSNGKEIAFKSLFLATGSEPRHPNFDGANLDNVFVLRTVNDANNINKQLSSEKDVVILGASFIGMEAAAYCTGKVKSVTVIGSSEVPFQNVLGESIGRRLMQVHEEKGVKFIMNSGIKSLSPREDDTKKVGFAKLKDGTSLPADVVIFGIGATPNTKFLKDSGINLTQNGSILVNKHLETNLKGIYAGGDIAHAPVFDKSASIGHWQLAHYHGRVAGRNMAGHKTNLQSVPFFWTMLFGKTVRYAGYAPQFDDIVILGNVENLQFVAYYCNGDDVLAVSTIGSDPIAAKFAEYLASGGKLTKDQVKSDPQWSK